MVTCGPNEYFDPYYGGPGKCMSCDEICNPATVMSMRECIDNGCRPTVPITPITGAQIAQCGVEQYFDQHYGSSGACRPCDEICNPAIVTSMDECVTNGCTPIVSSGNWSPDNVTKLSIICAVSVALAVVSVIILICVLMKRKRRKDKLQMDNVEMQPMVTTEPIPTAPELADVIHELCMSPKPAPLVSGIITDRPQSNDGRGDTNAT